MEYDRKVTLVGSLEEFCRLYDQDWFCEFLIAHLIPAINLAVFLATDFEFDFVFDTVLSQTRLDAHTRQF